MWSRVVGDTIELALLGAAWRDKRADADRLRGAAAIVGGLWVVDLVTAVALSRADHTMVRDGSSSEGRGTDHEDDDGPTRLLTALTIHRSEEEVRRGLGAFAWSALDPTALERAGELRLVAAAGDRGTELHLDHEPPVAGGAVGAVAAKAAGRSPDQAISDELRRFKALLVIPASETSPAGASAARQILHKRQPAQPVEDRS